MNMPRPADSEARRQRIGALALVAVGLFFLGRRLAALPFGTIANPGPGITPCALAILLVACALWTMIGASSAVDATEAGDAEAGASDAGAGRHAAFIVLGILAAALAFGVVGYRMT